MRLFQNIRYFLIWARTMPTQENRTALVASLQRRIMGRDLLEMALPLRNATIPAPRFVECHLVKFSDELIPEVVAFLNAIGNLGWWSHRRFTNEILRKVKNPQEDVFLLERNGKISAMAVLHPPQDELGAEIGFVAVAKAFRGKGIGQTLLLHIISTARNRRYPRVWLHTDAFRLPAIKTYLRIGMQPQTHRVSHRARWISLAKAFPAISPHLQN